MVLPDTGHSILAQGELLARPAVPGSNLKMRLAERLNNT